MRTSPLERELEIQLRGAGIRFVREFPFCAWRRWRADVFALKPHHFEPDPYRPGPERGVLVEIQGGGFVQGGHSRGMGLERDCEKMATAAALGWRVVPVTGRMVKDGRALALIEAALGLRALEAPKPKPKVKRAQRIPGRHGGKGLPEWNGPALIAPRGGRSLRKGLPERVRKAAGL